MTLTAYELIYILKPDVSEETNLSLVHSFRNLIREKGGKNVVIQHRGRRHLSYNIKHYYDGIYVQVNYKGNGVLAKLLEKQMGLNENVLRYLTVKN